MTSSLLLQEQTANFTQAGRHRVKFSRRWNVYGGDTLAIRGLTGALSCTNRGTMYKLTGTTPEGPFTNASPLTGAVQVRLSLFTFLFNVTN